MHVDSVIGAVKMPFANYENFEACVQANSDKSDPEGYCASIKRKVEGEDINVINEVLMSLGEIGEDGILKDAQLMPLGKWSHPLGVIDITPDRAKKFAEQFKANVAGQQLPVLFIHSDKANVANPNYGRAAGWFTDMRGDDNLGVVVDIKFTPEGRDAVNKKEYAYLSAEYFDQVQLPHHESPQDDVVIGASLVNRPHLKGMKPLLNEETGHQFLLGQADSPIKGDIPMDPILRQLAEQAQITLSDDQSELTEDQQKALQKFLSDQKKTFDETSAKVTTLEKQLADTEDPDKARARSLEELGFPEEAKLLSEYRADRMVKTLGEFAPKGHRLSPAAEKVAREYALEQTPENLAELHKMLLSEDATVDLRELGTVATTDDEGDDDDPAAKALEEAEKIAKEKEISIGEATSIYFKEHPSEWNKYQRSLEAPIGARMEEGGR